MVIFWFCVVVSTKHFANTCAVPVLPTPNLEVSESVTVCDSICQAYKLPRAASFSPSLFLFSPPHFL